VRRFALVIALLGVCEAVARPEPAGPPPRAQPGDWPLLGQVTLSLTPMYAVAYEDTRTANGGGFALDLGVGLSDALSLHARSALSWMDAPATKMLPKGALSTYAATVGLTYTLDVIRLVPAFDLSIGAVGLRGDLTFGSTSRAAAVAKPVDAFAVSLGFILDYLLTRHVSVGVEVRYHLLTNALDRVPMYLYAGPRVMVRWGGR
jgi:hypothetical protein